MINGILGWLGDFGGLNEWVQANTPYQEFSLEFILGYAFAPLMWLIGIAKEDVALMGQLLSKTRHLREFLGRESHL